MHIKDLDQLKELVRYLAPLAGPGRPVAEPAMQDDPNFKPVVMGLVSRVVRLLANGEKIAAIRAVREVTNCGLVEGKDVIEGIYRP